MSDVLVLVAVAAVTALKPLTARPRFLFGLLHVVLGGERSARALVAMQEMRSPDETASVYRVASTRDVLDRAVEVRANGADRGRTQADAPDE